MERNAGSTKHRVLTDAQVKQLRSTCDTNTPGNKRNLAILDSMLYQGMRLSEVANLKLEHIHPSGDNFFIHIKRRPKPIKAHPRWLNSLNGWLNQRGLSLEDDRGPVFVQIAKYVKSPRKSLGKRTISYLVAEYGNRAGITPVKGANRLFPKDLRRTCAWNAYDHGASLLAITAFLGFNHLETTARFIDVLDFADPAEAVDQIQYE